jgi:hypothetical protein
MDAVASRHQALDFRSLAGTMGEFDEGLIRVRQAAALLDLVGDGVDGLRGEGSDQRGRTCRASRPFRRDVGMLQEVGITVTVY